MMIVMVVFMLMGPHHGFTGHKAPRQAEAPYTQMERMANPDE